MANRYNVNFQGKVIEATVTEKARVIEEWLVDITRAYSGKRIIMGLDCEWKPNTMVSMNNKIATLQLCVASKCIIIQMCYLDYVPQSINNFFVASNVTLVGAEVQNDVLKLQNDYGIGGNAKTADIQALAMSRYPGSYYTKPSLKKLAEDFSGFYMEKPSHVCRSEWDARDLSGEQIHYACVDAFASYQIGSSLLNNR